MSAGQAGGRPQAETDGPLVLALDVGTSSTRAMLFDARGVATVQAAHRAAREAIRRAAPHVKVGFSLSLQQVQAKAGAEKFALDAWHRKFRQWLPLIEGDDFVATQTYTRSIYDVGSKFHVAQGARFTQMKFEFAPEALAAVLAGGTWTPPDVDMSSAPDREAADLARRLTSLTPQQVRVLMMLSEGLLNKQIAYELNVSEATIKAHVSAILQKLGVESRTQAAIFVTRTLRA